MNELDDFYSSIREILSKARQKVYNLTNFDKSYAVCSQLTWSQEKKLYALRRELTWSHYHLIRRVGNSEARDYYIRESADQRWSARVLNRKDT